MMNLLGEDARHKIWKSSVEFLKTRGWSYIGFEGDITRLLLHNADPFELFFTQQLSDVGDLYFLRRFDSAGQIRAAEMARAKSYDQTLCTFADDFDCESHEEAEIAKAPQFFAAWASEGKMRRAKDKGSILSDEEDVTIDDEEMQHLVDSDDASSTTSSTSSWYWSQLPQDGCFQRATWFPSHISTPEGRRQMSRFPPVRAFCDAVQYAGHRAEMDDDGDIWYDCEDGDRYFDARELQPLIERSDWPVEAWSICHDFEKYGLVDVLRRAEEEKRAPWEYRDKVREQRRNYF